VDEAGVIVSRPPWILATVDPGHLPRPHHLNFTTLYIHQIAIVTMVDEAAIQLVLRDFRQGVFPSLNKAAKAYRVAPSILKTRYLRDINRVDRHVVQ